MDEGLKKGVLYQSSGNAGFLFRVLRLTKKRVWLKSYTREGKPFPGKPVSLTIENAKALLFGPKSIKALRARLSNV